MHNNLTAKTVFGLRFLIFDYIGKRFQVDITKQYMDKLFVLFEKIAINFEALSSAYLSIYEQIVKNEVDLAQITTNDQILVIGGGTLPITPVLYAKHTQATIVSIDKDPQAVKYSKKFIAHHTLNNKITITLAQGENYPVEGFSVIVVVYGIKNTPAVLQYLSKNMDNTKRLLFRTTYDQDNKAIIEDIDLSALFDVKTHIRSASLGQVDTFLLTKKTVKQS